MAKRTETKDAFRQKLDNIGISLGEFLYLQNLWELLSDEEQTALVDKENAF